MTFFLTMNYIVKTITSVRPLKVLDAIHHQASAKSGSFRTSPVDSLYDEANEPPLDLRRLKLILKYIVKLKAYIDNPAFDCVFNPQYENLYDKNKQEAHRP